MSALYLYLGTVHAGEWLVQRTGTGAVCKLPSLIVLWRVVNPGFIGGYQRLKFTTVGFTMICSPEAVP